jgi:hypothetical protein
MSTLDQRKRWNAYWASCRAIWDQQDALEAQALVELEAQVAAIRAGRRPPIFAAPPPLPPHPPFPEDLRGLRCGARTRGGWPCKRIDINRGAKCKFHGGMSTGPQTPEGKKISARNGDWRRRTEAHGRLRIVGIADPMKGHEKSHAHAAVEPRT